MAALAFITCAVVLVSPLTPVSAFTSDIISDITTSEADEGRALGIKASQFWEPVQRAAHDAETRWHSAVYADTEKALARLPSENTYVREALTEALAALRRADKSVSTQGAQSSEIAAEGVAAGGGWESVFSFMTGGQDYFSRAVRNFMGGQYSDQLRNHVNKRQAEVLPALRGVQSVTGNVLKDCRTASRRSFDVLKYDLYNKNVPKTPDFVKPIADRLVDAAGETRHSFMSLITETAKSISKDTEGKEEHPSATVTTSLIQGIGELQRGGVGSGAGLSGTSDNGIFFAGDVQRGGVGSGAGLSGTSDNGIFFAGDVQRGGVGSGAGLSGTSDNGIFFAGDVQRGGVGSGAGLSGTSDNGIFFAGDVQLGGVGSGAGLSGGDNIIFAV